MPLSQVPYGSHFRLCPSVDFSRHFLKSFGVNRDSPLTASYSLQSTRSSYPGQGTLLPAGCPRAADTQCLPRVPGPSVPSCLLGSPPWAERGLPPAFPPQWAWARRGRLSWIPSGIKASALRLYSPPWPRDVWASPLKMTLLLSTRANAGRRPVPPHSDQGRSRPPRRDRLRRSV